MQHADPIEQARRLVRSQFPEALSVVLAGSTATGRAIASGDLDIAVLIENGRATAGRAVLRRRRCSTSSAAPP
ncbi:nucleotidyltransferase domain-containing protein [Streptomyces sp. NPDC000075]|uniref:nucleotidyltransferase domain-containing protein n=1 Tax=Streptomyces TaxID=1883 RepID=UPI0031DBAC33